MTLKEVSGKFSMLYSEFRSVYKAGDIVHPDDDEAHRAFQYYLDQLRQRIDELDEVIGYD